MATTYGSLIATYHWVDIEPVLPTINVRLLKSMSEYREAYAKLQALPPVHTRMRIAIRRNEAGTPGIYFDVVGRDGTRFKDAYRSEKARSQFAGRLEQEVDYAIFQMDWNVINGMAIDEATLTEFPEQEIVARVLVEITKSWHSDDETREVLEELEAIRTGQPRDLVQRQRMGNTGFLQVWSEKPNGVFHGKYAVFWDGSTTMAEEGIIIDGNQEGVWTYWGRDGKVQRQIRFSCDRPVQENRKAPWWEGAKDQ